jgi:cytochrome P450
MTDRPADTLSFPTPDAADARPQSARAAAGAGGRRDNPLVGLPPRVYEEMAVGRSMIGRRQIILSDPVAIRHVLIENADNYGRTASIYRLLGPVLGRGMLLADGEDWREQRRAAAPAFAPRAMGAIAFHVARGGERLIDQLAAAGNNDIDLYAHLQLTTLEIAAAALFSIDLGGDAPPLRVLLQRYARGPGRAALLDFILPRGWPTPRSWARWRYRRRWMAQMARIVAARRAAEPAPDQPRDLFDMMAATTPSAKQLVAEVATVLVAGHETTAVALFWACYVLAAMPDMQERIAAEATPLDLSPAGAAAAVPGLVYTRAVIDEALRLYPPAFSITRQARAADDANGIAIAQRTVVLIVPWVLHRHVKLWRDPNLFDPGRFLPGADPVPVRFSYLPFGAGARACIGAQFALTEAVIMLAQLMRAFRVELADDRPVLPLAAVTLQPDHSPPFRLRPR